MSDAVMLGYIGLAGLIVTNIGQILQTWLGHKKILASSREAKDAADSAYVAANGFNEKLETVKQEIEIAKGATAK